jgi:hypothetical protein
VFFIDEARQARRVSGPPRLVFALDATASRQETWDLACRLQAEMFTAAASVGKLDVQLVYFRGDREFHASPYVPRADMLTRIMQEIACRSGHTQISRVLQHVQREVRQGPVAALVYVGDTHEEQHGVLVRHAEGMGVPAFVFHEDPDKNADAARTFEAIAKASGGVYLPFNRRSAAELAGLLAAIGAFAAGGLPALKKQGGAGARLLLRHLR